MMMVSLREEALSPLPAVAASTSISTNSLLLFLVYSDNVNTRHYFVRRVLNMTANGLFSLLGEQVASVAFAQAPCSPNPAQKLGEVLSPAAPCARLLHGQGQVERLSGYFPW